MSICRISACGRSASGYSPYCVNHKRNKSRHGHPEQHHITKNQLATFLRTTRARIAKNANSPIWPKLDNFWLDIVNESQEYLAASSRGIAGNRYSALAHAEIVKVSQHANPREVVEVILAVYLLEQWQSKLFQSDDAFGFQLVHRVRALSPAGMGSYWDHEARTTRTVYREKPPQMVAAMARMIRERFAVAGYAVAQLEAREQQQKRDQQQQFNEQLHALN